MKIEQHQAKNTTKQTKQNHKQLEQNTPPTNEEKHHLTSTPKMTAIDHQATKHKEKTLTDEDSELVRKL